MFLYFLQESSDFSVASSSRSASGYGRALWVLFVEVDCLLLQFCSWVVTASM